MSALVPGTLAWVFCLQGRVAPVSSLAVFQASLWLRPAWTVGSMRTLWLFGWLFVQAHFRSHGKQTSRKGQCPVASTPKGEFWQHLGLSPLTLRPCLWGQAFPTQGHVIISWQSRLLQFSTHGLAGMGPRHQATCSEGPSGRAHTQTPHTRARTCKHVHTHTRATHRPPSQALTSSEVHTHSGSPGLEQASRAASCPTSAQQPESLPERTLDPESCQDPTKMS